MVKTATEWALWRWKTLHDTDYFPNSDQHKDWRIYEKMNDWFLDIAKPVKADNVLAIGAGYGEWMIPLSRLVGTITGIDLHKILPVKAREKFREHNVSNATFFQNDGTTVPFRENTFSLVYSISVFQHIPRAIVYGYLRESARVMTPDGRAVHHFRNADDVGPYPPLATDIVADHTGDFSCGWTVDQIREAGEAAGLKCEVHKIPLFLVLHGTRK